MNAGKSESPSPVNIPLKKTEQDQTNLEEVEIPLEVVSNAQEFEESLAQLPEGQEVKIFEALVQPITRTHKDLPITHTHKDLPITRTHKDLEESQGPTKQELETHLNLKIPQQELGTHLNLTTPQKLEDNEPLTHKVIEKQPESVFDRFPRMKLELEKWFHIKWEIRGWTIIDFDLAIPLVAVKSVITNALHNSKYAMFFPVLNFLATNWYGIPGGYPDAQYAAISLERIILLKEHKDTIIKMCNHPGFSQNEVMQYISENTGMMFDVHENPKETIRLVEDLLRVTEKVLSEGMPAKIDDETRDKEAVQAFFEEKMVKYFPTEDLKAYDQFKRLREAVFMPYADKHPVESTLVQGEMRVVPVVKQEVIGNAVFNEARFDQELVAYKKNAPSSESARDEVNYAKYMSANSFKEHLLKTYGNNEAEIDKCLNKAVDDCLLGCYLPNCDDYKDSDEKILEEEFIACRLNNLPDSKGFNTSANSFRYSLLDKPTLNPYNIDKFLQEKIQDGLISPYVPSYKTDGTADLQTILNEEALAYKLNRQKAAISEEKTALEKYLKEDRNIIGVQGTKGGTPDSINQADLTLFLFEYTNAHSKPYVPLYDQKTTYISRILAEELAAYKLNVELEGKPFERQGAENYLKGERKILNVKGIEEIDLEAVKISEADLTQFLDSVFQI